MASAPEFGHALLPYFALDPTFVNLNHGSFGALPKPVLEECSKLTLEVEANPDYFLRVEFEPRLNEVRRRVAALLGADTDEVVLVPSVANGMNTVLRNFEWNEGDVIVPTSTTFDSITRAVNYISSLRPNPSTSKFNLTFPTSHAQILTDFRAHLRSIKRAPNAKVVAVLDSIVSGPGVVLPWREMVEICKQENVWSVIDAAHSIGHEVDINLTKAAPDFFVTSLHKWLYAKRACAVLYVPARNQHIIKSSLPTACNYNALTPNKFSSTFVSEFLWFGAIDVVPALSNIPALEFREWLGGEKKINDYCRSLALAGGKRLAEVMGTTIMDSPNSGELTLNMVNVEIPLPGDIKPSPQIYNMWLEKLMKQRKVFATQFYHNGKWWTRASAQVYNEIEDFEKLGKALEEVCKEIVESQA
ncbi:PLP-dependent transferase [Wolfiporia cocos MD-104 SS10]|uniref:PLP-dependent transferase n=1 Tax=Wolfiporia cocos (strain MD-104) TaxID=742152 RepID=A0A2H3JC38_WOLCO|nr:PLP-dependent transferase [Wolfiporia cocos MD-104 SS10]